MDPRKFEAGASGTPPTPPAVPSTGYPSPGNPGTATPATKPGPWWFHQIGEELRYVLTQAGITPDHTSLTQLWAALQALMASNAETQAGALTTKAVTPASLASFGKAHSLNGYQKFPGGLIIQWGKVSSVNMDTDSIYSVTFPIAFPNSVFFVNPTLRRSGSTTKNIAAYVNAEGLSGFDTVLDKDATESVSNGNIYWLAVGN